MKCYPFLLLLILCAYLSKAQTNLDSGLVAYYPFDGDFRDMTAYANEAASPAPPTFGEGLTGALNEACYFNGITQHLEIPHAPQIDFEQQDEFAISLWIKPPVNQIATDGVVNDIISKWHSVNSEPYPFAIRLFNQTHMDNGNLWIGRYESNMVGCDEFPRGVSKRPVNDSEWHHVVLQKKNGELVLFIDASTQLTLEDNTTCSVQNTSNIILGRRTTNPIIDATRRFEGGMDELRFYNRSLSNYEIILLSQEQSSATTNVLSEDWSVHPNLIQAGKKISIAPPTGQQIESIKLYSVHGHFIENIEFNRISPNVLPGVYMLKANTNLQNLRVLPIVVY